MDLLATPELIDHAEISLQFVPKTSAFRDIFFDLMAGSFGGAVGVVVGHPLDMVKTRMQSQTLSCGQLSVLQCLRATKRSDGFRGLWRGVAPPFFSQGLWQASAMASYELAYKEAIREGVPDQTARLGAGLISGAVSCLVVVPAETIKVQLQVSQAECKGALTETVQCARDMIRSNGVGSLYQGTWACLWRDVPTVALYFYSYAKAKESLTRFFGDKHGFLIESMSGGFAGSLSWGFACPMDVVKTVSQESANSKQPLGLIAATSKVWQSSGWRGFFRGFGPLVVRSFPVNAVTFAVYEASKRSLGMPSAL